MNYINPYHNGIFTTKMSKEELINKFHLSKDVIKRKEFMKAHKVINYKDQNGEVHFKFIDYKENE